MHVLPLRPMLSRSSPKVKLSSRWSPSSVLLGPRRCARLHPCARSRIPKCEAHSQRLPSTRPMGSTAGEHRGRSRRRARPRSP